jgi:beta-lactamase regulating signal transducer with metallopeptidase domain
MPLVHGSDLVLARLAEWGSAVFAGFARAAAPVAVAALWQDALVALALVLCLRFVLRISAAHRFAAWAAGFAVAALLPFLPFLEDSGSLIAATPAGGVTARPWLELDSRWGFAIAALWLAASTFRAAELALNLRRLRRLWRGATPVEMDASLHSVLAALPARRIEICTTSHLDRPSVIGFFAPRILIPDWLYLRLTPSELEQVVLHEAEHLRRRDDWTNLLQKLSLVLFPLNPALAWMDRRLCREREMACDEGVVRKTQAPRIYASCLAALAERGLERRELQRREVLRRAQALSLGAFERRPELVHRVDSILRRRKTLHPLAAGTLVGVVGCALLFGAVELSRSPQLVAFVAAPKPDPQVAAVAPLDAPRIARIFDGRISEPSPTADVAVFHPSGRYRAIETKSAVPATRHAAGPPVAAQSPRGDETLETAMTNREATPYQVMVNVAGSAPAAASSQSQEFIVLTAWEEVQTSVPQSYGRTTREVADYDTGADTQIQSDAAAGERNTSPASRISVTRLIVLVYPANAAMRSPAATATDAKPAQTASSHSHRPTASVFDGGWLFFQL